MYIETDETQILSPVSFRAAVSTFLVTILALLLIREDPIPKQNLYLLAFLLPPITLLVDYTWSLASNRLGKTRSVRHLNRCSLYFEQQPHFAIPYTDLLQSLAAVRKYSYKGQYGDTSAQIDILEQSLTRLRHAQYVTYDSLDPNTSETLASDLQRIITRL